MLNNKKYYANGKLLLLGEYALLSGATGLVLPVIYGQSLECTTRTDSKHLLTWSAYDTNGMWFHAKLNTLNFEIQSSTNLQIAFKLQEILFAIRNVKKDFLYAISMDITSILSYPLEWGMGSSSTLIANLAKLADINPYDIYFKLTNGSGFDLAAAVLNTPFLYCLVNKNPVVKKLNATSNWLNNLYFVYMNKKVSTKDHLKSLGNVKFTTKQLDRISELSASFLSAPALIDLYNLVNEHEDIISSVIGFTKVKDIYFSDFKGAIKSMGAWGGDFIMAITDQNCDYVKDYFKKKGFFTVLRMNETIINEQKVQLDFAS